MQSSKQTAPELQVILNKMKALLHDIDEYLTTHSKSEKQYNVTDNQ